MPLLKTEIRFVVILTAVMLLLQACSGVPSDVIPPKKMAMIMADIHTGEAVVEQNRAFFSSDSVKLLFRQSIYSRYGYTAEEVDSSMMWYGRNLDKYIEVYDMTVEELHRRIDETSRLASADLSTATIIPVQPEGDSVDVWQWVRQRPFGFNMASDNLVFELKTNRNWEDGDIYRLRYKISGYTRPVIVTVAADYPDGKVDYVAAETHGDGWHETVLVLDPERSPSVIYGSISAPAVLPDTDSDIVRQPMCVDSLSFVRMRKDQRNVTKQRQLQFHHQ